MARSDDVSTDLHIKMCKKIAQITKVVFHLNTKLAENQRVIDKSKSEHDKNLQCLTEEYNAKILKYEQQCEVALQHQKEADHFQSDFEKMKQENQYLQLKLDEYQETHTIYNQQLKNDFEEKIMLLQHQLIQQRHESEEVKKILTADLENKTKHSLKMLALQHQDEMQAFKSNSDKIFADMEFQKENSDNLKKRIQSLEELKDNLEFEIATIKSSYDNKIKQLNFFYENQYDSINKKHAQDNRDLQERGISQHHDFELKVSDLQNHIHFLQCSLTEKETVIEKLKLDSAMLKNLLNANSLITSKVKDEVEVNQQFISALEEKLKNNENTKVEKLHELELVLNKLEKERDIALLQLVEKDGTLTDLQMALKNTNYEMNKRLKEFKDLQDAYSKLQEENKIYQKVIESEKSSSSNFLEDSKKCLSKKEEEIKILLSELNQMRIKHNSEVCYLEKKFKEDLISEKEVHSKSVEILQKKYEKMLVDSKGKLCNELKQDQQNITAIYCKLIEEKEATIMFLKTDAENQVAQITSLKSQLDSCVNTENKLNEDLLKTMEKLSVAESRNVFLEKCIIDTQSGERKHEMMWKEEKNRLHQSFHESLINERQSIEAEWQIKLNNEILKWQLKLNDKEENEKKEASKVKHIVQLLNEEKEQELVSLKEQICHLNTVISQQQHNISLTLCEHQKKIELLNAEFEDEKRLIKNDLSLTISSMKSAHTKDIENCNLLWLKDKENAISTLHHNFEALILEIRNENLLSINALKSNSEYEKKQALDELARNFEKDKESLQSILHLQYNEKMKKESDEFAIKFMVCKEKLKCTKALRQNELSVHTQKISDLVEQLVQEKDLVKTLREKILNMADEAIKIGKEIDIKGQEVLEVRRECNTQMRERLDDMIKKHRVDLEEVKAKYSHKMRMVLDEWSDEKLKYEEEAAVFKHMLEKANETFLNRPSRNEDVELINELKNCMLERDAELRKLKEERQHYRLELINREQNFNKLFNTSPNVGIMDPISRRQSASYKKL